MVVISPCDTQTKIYLSSLEIIPTVESGSDAIDKTPEIDSVVWRLKERKTKIKNGRRTETKIHGAS